VGRLLRQRGIPFVFSTGYGSVEADFTDAPILRKPFDERDVVTALQTLLSQPTKE
jgi:hypothetical protein